MARSNIASETEEEEKILFEIMEGLKGFENWMGYSRWLRSRIEYRRNNCLPGTEKADNENEVVDEQPATKISNQEGFAVFDKALIYIKQTPADLLPLNIWKNKIAYMII